MPALLRRSDGWPQPVQLSVNCHDHLAHVSQCNGRSTNIEDCLDRNHNERIA